MLAGEHRNWIVKRFVTVGWSRSMTTPLRWRQRGDARRAAWNVNDEDCSFFERSGCEIALRCQAHIVSMALAP